MTKVGGKQKDRGVKKAPFVVLIGANMPSVLAEISFLTNPKDERMLKQPEYRQKDRPGALSGGFELRRQPRRSARCAAGSSVTARRGGAAPVGNHCARTLPHRSPQFLISFLHMPTPAAKRLWLAFALIIVPLAWAEKPSTITLIPASDWRVSSTEKADLSTVSQFGGDPAVEREYGVDSISLRTYELRNITVKVIVAPSPDASTAFGLLTYYRTEGMNAVKGVPLAWAGPDGALMARGRYFYRVPRASTTKAEFSDSDFRDLLSVIGNSHPPGEVNASLPDALPASGIDRRFGKISGR